MNNKHKCKGRGKILERQTSCKTLLLSDMVGGLVLF